MKKSLRWAIGTALLWAMMGAPLIGANAADSTPTSTFAMEVIGAGFYVEEGHGWKIGEDPVWGRQFQEIVGVYRKKPDLRTGRETAFLATISAGHSFLNTWRDIQKALRAAAGMGVNVPEPRDLPQAGTTWQDRFGGSINKVLEGKFEGVYFRQSDPSRVVRSIASDRIVVDFGFNNSQGIPPKDFAAYWVGRFTFPQETPWYWS